MKKQVILISLNVSYCSRHIHAKYRAIVHELGFSGVRTLMRGVGASSAVCAITMFIFGSSDAGCFDSLGGPAKNSPWLPILFCLISDLSALSKIGISWLLCDLFVHARSSDHLSYLSRTLHDLSQTDVGLSEVWVLLLSYFQIFCGFIIRSRGNNRSRPDAE